MTLFSRNVLVGGVDLVLGYPSILIVLVGLDQDFLLFLESRFVSLQLSVLRLEVSDVLKELIDEADGKEDTDSDDDAQDSEQDHLESNLLTEGTERNLG